MCRVACATGVVKLAMKAVNAKRDQTQSDDASKRSQFENDANNGGLAKSFKML